MHSREIELDLFERVWRKRIDGLTQTLSETKSERLSDEEDRFDERSPEYGLHAQIAVYKLCLDWVFSEREAATHTWNDRRASARERFHHLMAVLAKMEIACHEEATTMDWVSPAANVEPLPREDQVRQLMGAVSSVLDAMTGTPAAQPVNIS